jgi:peroxiredoxin
MGSRNTWTAAPIPAEFLIDSNGIIRWVNLTENIAVRARPEQVLEAFEQEQPAGSQ